MSWLLNLYETYQTHSGRIGEIEKKANGQEYTLLPISHTTQNAHIEVSITEEGEFHSAEVIDKEDANTLIPCTEDAASRSGSKIAPYPLHDKLSYVAGDFVTYGGKTKKEEPFAYYIQQLENWASSPYGHDKIKSIFRYLRKRTLIKDLVAERILFLDEDNKLMDSWDKNKHAQEHREKPAIFRVVAGGQENAFIRFTVHSPNKIETKVWKDKEIYESFISYYNQRLGDHDLCYVTGKWLPKTEKHANKIRNAADKAKLISSNDSSGFTYRGRFKESNEAASISYEVSQKAHNALKWLIHRQGKIIDQRVFLVWGNHTETSIPDPLEDSFDLFAMDLTPEASSQEEKRETFTNQNFAAEVAKALDGYKNNLSSGSEVNIMILDSATTGRMAVLYYRNLHKDLYFDRLKRWHSRCVWQHRYRKNQKNQYVSFYGAPSTKDIAYAALGSKANDKVVKGIIERMLPCIIDCQRIPADIIRSAFHRASNPVSMETWEWEKTLSVTCALINYKEGYSVALDSNNQDRNYLFGRLLAVADVLERRALGADETRATNAIRYMNSFSRHPARTWKTVQDSLQPYQAKLGTKGIYLTKLIDEIAAKFQLEDFNNKPLSELYLLGFYSQRHALYQKKE